MTAGDASNCRNCAALLTGRYCATCGQKALTEDDRRLKPLLAGFFAELTAIDGKFWRSLVALLFVPGRLGRAWLDGRRQHYMNPITLFLIANALYFLSPGLSDFDLSLRDQTYQFHSRWTRPWLDAVIAARGLDLTSFAQPYAIASGNVGKLLLIVHVPFIAAVLALLRRDRTIWFAEHFVVALNAFTFAMLFVQLEALLSWFVRGTRLEPDGKISAYALLAVALLYLVLALRRSYRAGWWWSAHAALAVFGIMVAANLYVYRTLQFLLALAIA